MLSPADLTQLIVALTGLIVAIATLVQAFRNVHAKIDAADQRITSLENGEPPPPEVVNR